MSLTGRSAATVISVGNASWCPKSIRKTINDGVYFELHNIQVRLIYIIYIYIYIYKIFMVLTNSLCEIMEDQMLQYCYHDDDHHHVVQPVHIFLTLGRHFSLSFIASGRSSGLHPLSSQRCHMYVRAGRPAFARPYMCPACLVHLTWIIFLMGGRWSYSWCFVGCCLQDLFNIPHSILV